MQESHVAPLTPGLQLHCPVYALQVKLMLPTALQAQLWQPFLDSRFQKPSEHRSHVRPLTFSRQKHCPFCLLQFCAIEPNGLQWHSVANERKKTQDKKKLI